ncbi:MAG: hypothetical protein ABIH21_00475 [Patescibacteria group bacterium]
MTIFEKCVIFFRSLQLKLSCKRQENLNPKPEDTMGAMGIFMWGLFIMAAGCYVLFLTSDPMESLGTRLGKLLRLPEDVIASTFAAAATSGPEIVMAILAATGAIMASQWNGLEVGERACSGTLNMSFSAMDNLLGIGAVAIVFMIFLKHVKKEDLIPRKPSTIVGLGFYMVASFLFALFVNDNVLTYKEGWTLAVVGIVYVLAQFVIPYTINKYFPDDGGDGFEDDEEDDDDDEAPVPSLTKQPGAWSWDFVKTMFMYAALVFALVIIVREVMGATFDMGTTGYASVGGILLLFTSYVSSFPEFMMSYRFAVAGKRAALLAMLFGSNVIDLAFAGFRAIWLHEDMAVYTTGRFPELLPYYIWCLPVIAGLMLLLLLTRKLKWAHAYPMVAFYVIYIVSGFILL